MSGEPWTTKCWSQVCPGHDRPGEVCPGQFGPRRVPDHTRVDEVPMAGAPVVSEAHGVSDYQVARDRLIDNVVLSNPGTPGDRYAKLEDEVWLPIKFMRRPGDKWWAEHPPIERPDWLFSRHLSGHLRGSLQRVSADWILSNFSGQNLVSACSEGRTVSPVQKEAAVSPVQKQ